MVEQLKKDPLKELLDLVGMLKLLLVFICPDFGDSLNISSECSELCTGPTILNSGPLLVVGISLNTLQQSNAVVSTSIHIFALDSWSLFWG